MRRLLNILLLLAGLCLFFTMGTAAYAGMPSKGLKIDPLLKQAIEDSAEKVSEEEVEEVPVEPPVFEEPEEIVEEKPLFKLPDLPEFPVFIEEKPEEIKQSFTWPDEPGYMFNGVKFLPSLLAKMGYNDNLFATEAVGDTDLVANVTPRLRIEIPDIRHEFSLEGEVEVLKYLENDDEDHHNSRIKMDGALIALHGLAVPFGFVLSKTHEEREDDLTQQRPVSPLDIDTFKGESGIEFKPNSFGIALLGRYEKNRFEDGIAKSTGAEIVRRDADRDIVEMEFNTSFDFDDVNTLMLWGTYGQRDYQKRNFQAGGFNGPKRSSDTFSGMLSWIFDAENLNGHISVGLDDLNYEDPAIADIREIVGDMEVDHRIGDLTSVNFQLERSVFEDDEAIDPIIRSRAGLYFDHRPWNEILVAVGADFNFLEFNNSARDDETWDFRAIVDYFYNDFLAFGGEYAYTQRDSEMDGLDFRRNVFWLRARGRL